MNQVENYLSSQIKERLTRANIFEDRITKDREMAVTLQKEIQKYKKDNPDKGYEEIKEKLIETQKLHYYSALIEMQLKQEVGLIKEFSTMADILKIDIELSDEHKEVVKFIQKMNNDFFITDSSSNIIVKDEENKKMIEQGLAQNLSNDTRLKEMYNMIPVN